MGEALQKVLNNLQELLDKSPDVVQPPEIYLDPEAVRHIFTRLTGLAEPPRIGLRFPPDGGPALAVLEPSAGNGRETPPHLLFAAMAPLLAERLPLTEKPEDLAVRSNHYARILGFLQTTRFPDGRLNLEIGFAGLRGMLFYTKPFFNSMVRPLLGQNRFYSLETWVEAVVYVVGPIQRAIFYHQAYGDNREHDWLPLVPVVIRAVAVNTEEVSA